MAWEVNECLLKDCPLLKDKKKVILFQPEDIRRIKALLKKFEHKEWLLYLYGDIVEDGAIISGMTIPKQEVSGGSVDEISPPLPGCIGTIHSHNSMGAFHSGTDQAHLETNHTVAITVNNKLEFDSTIQIKSECNRPVLIGAVVMVSEPELDLTSFMKEAEENITEKKYITTSYPNYYNGRVWDPQKREWVDDKLAEKKGTETYDPAGKWEKDMESYAGYWG